MIKLRGRRLTPKQWAAEVLASNLDNITGYYYELESGDHEHMTEKEQAAVGKHMEAMHDRIIKILEKARPKREGET